MASPSTSTGSRPGMNPGKLRVLLEMIKWEHTVFALPFAYAGMLAAPVPFSFSNLFWITVAMIGARTAGMTLNRIIDAAIDARNPRTADRAIPKGLVGVKEAWVFTVAAIALLVLATFFLAPITRVLWPLVVLGFVVYPYTKRFTWLCHLALGIANGLAPGAAWVAVTGEISWTPVFIWAGAALWVAGFDVIYALLDREFDLENRVNSLPARFGIGPALVVSRVWHALSVAFLVAFGAAAGLGVVYYLGIVVVAWLLFYEQSLVRVDDLSKLNVAFFTMNGVISAIFFLFVLLDRVIG
ncbi:MAG: putative 4-hydroxybenzoate polyprenyltransferase [Actinomycetota bacterium]|nr:putative 4-hydroxybenzoate polyprenyltransferase [Actinomycetota bacterium]